MHQSNLSRRLLYRGCYTSITVKSKCPRTSFETQMHIMHIYHNSLAKQLHIYTKLVVCPLKLKNPKHKLKKPSKSLNCISNLTLFNRLLIWSNRSQYCTNQQAKPKGKSVKKSSPHVGETSWGNHCLKGSDCLDLSVWPRSVQDHPSPIPKVFDPSNPGMGKQVHLEKAKSNLTSTRLRM